MGGGRVGYFLRPRVGLVEKVKKRSVVTCIVPPNDTKKPTAASEGDRYLHAMSEGRVRRRF